MLPPTPTSSPSSGAIVILRHGERLDYKIFRSGEGNWTATAARPYDTPLTPQGREQGRLAGVRVAELLAKHSLPLPTRAFTSPMLRCAETLSAVLSTCHHAASSGNCIKSMSIEHGLTESCNLDWYRSWSLPSSDSTWGGPRGGEKEEPSDERAFCSATNLLGTPEFLNSQHSATVTTPLTPWKSVESVSRYSYRNPESREQQFARLRRTVQGLASASTASGETIILCSHGGPCTHLFEELTGKDWTAAGECGYAAISIYVWEKTANNGEDNNNSDDDKWKWKCLEVNDCGHLGGKTLGGIIE